MEVRNFSKMLFHLDGEPDYRRSSILMISAFRRNKFGNMTLDSVT